MTLFEGACERVVEKALGFRARRLRTVRVRLEFAHYEAAVVEQREEPLNQRDGARGGIVDHRTTVPRPTRPSPARDTVIPTLGSLPSPSARDATGATT